MTYGKDESSDINTRLKKSDLSYGASKALGLTFFVTPPLTGAVIGSKYQPEFLKEYVAEKVEDGSITGMSTNEATTSYGMIGGMAIGTVILATAVILSRTRSRVGKKVDQFFDATVGVCQKFGDKVAELRYPENKSENNNTMKHTL